MLGFYECEKIIEALKPTDIREYGSQRWLKQHQQVSQLNLQAHINALMRGDEYVMESLASLDKVKLLIFETLVCDVWREKLFPLMRPRLVELGGIKSYIAVGQTHQLFHESVLVNLLESVLFHRTAVDAADDYLLELVDYCYRFVHRLASGKIRFVDPPSDPQALALQSREQDFDRQQAGIEFNIAVSAISILRYISDQVKHVAPAVVRHIHLENDLLMACVVLIEERPWLRNNKEGRREKFEDGRWVEVKKGEMSRLPKVEGQVWITVHNLLLAPECAASYEITDYRKNMLLRVCAVDQAQEVPQRTNPRPDPKPRRSPPCPRDPRHHQHQRPGSGQPLRGPAGP